MTPYARLLVADLEQRKIRVVVEPSFASRNQQRSLGCWEPRRDLVLIEGSLGLAQFEAAMVHEYLHVVTGVLRLPQSLQEYALGESCGGPTV